MDTDPGMGKSVAELIVPPLSVPGYCANQSSSLRRSEGRSVRDLSWSWGPGARCHNVSRPSQLEVVNLCENMSRAGSRLDDALQDAPAASQVPEAAGRFQLIRFPSALLGRLWPAERVVAGLRVCRLLRRELSEHAGTILLVKKEDTAEISEELLRDFDRVSHLEVVLKWQGTA
eukprot:1034584-Rhodomonas_salina.3